MFHHRELVGNEHHREPELVAQVEQQIQDLRLHRDVQGRDGLVRHYEVRLQEQGARDGQPLQLPAAELVRVTLQNLVGQADITQQPFNAGPGVLGGQLVYVSHLAQRLPNGHFGVEGRIGVLKNHLHLPAMFFHLLMVEIGYIRTPEQHLAAGHGQQTQDAAAQGRFAASAFPHDSVYLAPLYRQGNVVHRPQMLVLDGKIFLQLVHSNDFFAHHACILTAC